MAYCVLADVEGRMRGPALTSSSTPTIDEANQIIDDIAADIDAALSSLGLEAPVSAPAALVAWLRQVNVVGVLAEIADTRPQRKDTPSWWRSRYEKMLDRIWSGKVDFPGMALASGGLPTSYGVEYPDEAFDAGDIAEMVFNEDVKL